MITLARKIKVDEDLELLLYTSTITVTDIVELLCNNTAFIAKNITADEVSKLKELVAHIEGVKQ